ncbi:MAG: hypothetical protein AAB553_00450 [Patescibacteria group bacterium]
MLQNSHYLLDKNHASSLTAFLSSITPEDKYLLKQAISKFRPGSKNYEDSWGYIIQATRYRGFKWYDRQTDSLIFWGRKSDKDSRIVIPSFFANLDQLTYVINKVQKTLQTSNTILKNINIEDIDKFCSYGFRPYKEEETWTKEARFDDQTYPNSIVDLEKLLQLQGKDYHHLRKALRKDSYALIRKYKESDKDSVLRVFALRDGNSLNSSTSAYLKGMFYASHEMYPSASMEKFVVIDKISREVIGFTAFSEINSTNAAFVALIFKPGIKLASVWGIYQTLVIAYKKGFKTINFGGSEIEGTYVFVKRTFKPIEYIQKTHLVYDP